MSSSILLLTSLYPVDVEYDGFLFVVHPLETASSSAPIPYAFRGSGMMVFYFCLTYLLDALLLSLSTLKNANQYPIKRCTKPWRVLRKNKVLFYKFHFLI